MISTPRDAAEWRVESNRSPGWILPLQFKEGESYESLGLTGQESFDFEGLYDKTNEVSVIATNSEGKQISFSVDVRIDTPKEWDYYKHGGILQYVLRNMLAEQ